MATLPSSALASLAAKQPSKGIINNPSPVPDQLVVMDVTARMRVADSARASDVLKNLTEGFETVINGVPCVL